MALTCYPPEGLCITFYKFVPCMHINDGFLCNADYDADHISNFIACYAVSIPNLAVRNFS
jgi:hypothetical protein